MRAFRIILACLATVALVACASPFDRRLPVPEELFVDSLFAPPAEPASAEQIFALSDEMRRYIRTDMAPQVRRLGPREALIDALYKKGHLKLEYEASVTRTAAQAFAARSGNCLSLVIMSAAFARELGLQVGYQSAYLEEAWSRKGDLLLKSGHVNLTLTKRIGEDRNNPLPSAITIDFIPQDEIRNLRTVDVPERLIVAMFMNNRAVELLVDGRIDDAYAWAREAVRTDPGFLGAQNTLGVVYLRRNALPQAAAVFTHVLATKPDETPALANLAEVADREGRTADAARLRNQLARLEREPPLYYFNLGLAAMERGDYRSARALFSKEAVRGDAAADVHYWLGVANYRLGDLEAAAREMSLAAEASASRRERDLYSAKLDWLRTHRAN
jgi:tetratricopeptide (TPR) repeat protein